MLLDKTEQQVRKVTQKHILARQRCVCGRVWVCAHVVCDRCVCKVSAMASPYTSHTVCVCVCAHFRSRESVHRSESRRSVSREELKRQLSKQFSRQQSMKEAEEEEAAGGTLIQDEKAESGTVSQSAVTSASGYILQATAWTDYCLLVYSSCWVILCVCMCMCICMHARAYVCSLLLLLSLSSTTHHRSSSMCLSRTSRPAPTTSPCWCSCSSSSPTLPPSAPTSGWPTTATRTMKMPIPLTCESLVRSQQN